MARFETEGGNIAKKLGWWIGRLSARVAAGGLAAAQRPKFDPSLIGEDYDVDPGKGVALTDEFNRGLVGNFVYDESLPSAVEQGKRAEAAGGKDDIVYVQFHFDRTIESADGGKIKVVNVVVPDFGGKLITEDGKPVLDDDGEPCPDLKDIAEESMGMVLYSTCQD